ncbi:hypothetical protein LUZ63_003880 [Rhynchospora breviuscula]|uniref:DUF7866 domain-containing protein n=1 Tax=Rhynchospora breviuscula TaxID=2022672 RepID=A0A9Q0D1E8_9POAL|nr:hypothetical protein LUZ63_003880 [Rhynchospora breviuscula]
MNGTDSIQYSLRFERIIPTVKAALAAALSTFSPLMHTHSTHTHTHRARHANANTPASLISIQKKNKRNQKKLTRMRLMSPNLLILLLFLFYISNQAISSIEQRGSEEVSTTPKPVEVQNFGFFEFNQRRRRLDSFQLCAPCTCCGGSKGLCLVSPCCYAINCNIPNRPFGFCSFSPKSCDCTLCSL